MKRLYLLLISAFVVMASFAQNDEPNRLFVHEKSGNVKGFIVDRLDSISFGRVDGRVAADVTFKRYNNGDTGDTVWVAVTRTPACQAFRIACVPSNMANMLKDDASIASYMDQIGSDYLYQDFTDGQLTGFDKPFSDNTKYTLLTVGYDQYGIACEASRAEFTTPRKPLVGNPSVAWELNEAGTDNFTMTFTPNADVKGYALCSFDEGTMEQQFEQWGPMMGFTNIGDMIKQFSGQTYTGKYTNTWTGMTPGKTYDVAIQCWDANDTYADVIIAKVTTKSLGGDGVAEVTITKGDFGGDAVGGYWQKVTYTPNDQTAKHRDMIIEKKAYDTPEWGDEGILKYLKQDKPQDPYWDQYGVDEAQWNADPSTEYIAFSVAQNAKGEWGSLARLELTTPAAADASAMVKKAPAVSTRVAGAQKRNAVAPAMKVMKKKLTLTE